MSVTDLRPKVRLLDQRAAKANLWAMGLWALVLTVAVSSAVVFALASVREPIDQVVVQIPPAIEAVLNEVNVPLSKSFPEGSVQARLADVASFGEVFFRAFVITFSVLGFGLGVIRQSIAPAAAGAVLLAAVAVIGAVKPNRQLDTHYQELMQIVSGIEDRDYEAVRKVMMEQSKRFPELQEDFLWWQLAALSRKAKGVDFVSILAKLEANASELQPTPAVRYALEVRALGAPRSAEAKAFEKEALEVSGRWKGYGQILMAFGAILCLLASGAAVFARVLNRRVARIATLGVTA